MSWDESLVPDKRSSSDSIGDIRALPPQRYKAVPAWSRRDSYRRPEKRTSQHNVSDTAWNYTHEQDVRRSSTHSPSKTRCLTAGISAKVGHPNQRGIRSTNRTHPHRSVIQALSIHMQFPTRTTCVYPYVRRAFLQVVSIRGVIPHGRRRRRRNRGTRGAWGIR